MENQLMKIEFTDDQVTLIKKQIAPQANNDELKLFLYQCQRTGLDPLTRQIYCIHRGGRMTIQTAIDGFRVIAERSGQYAGQDEPIWIDDEKGLPVKCTVKVYKFGPNGERYCAGVGVAYYKEYYPNPMNLQKSMPHTMICKIAEALALRKAFPQDLSGLYTADEMQQADKPQTQDVDFSNVPDPEELQILRSLVFTSTLEEDGKESALIAIDACGTYEQYNKIKYRLEDLQGSIDNVPNPNQRDINRHIKKFVKQEA